MENLNTDWMRAFLCTIQNTNRYILNFRRVIALAVSLRTREYILYMNECTTGDVIYILLYFVNFIYIYSNSNYNDFFLFACR